MVTATHCRVTQLGVFVHMRPRLTGAITPASPTPHLPVTCWRHWIEKNQGRANVREEELRDGNANRRKRCCVKETGTGRVNIAKAAVT